LLNIQDRRATIAVSLIPVFVYALFRFSIGLVLPELAQEFQLNSIQAGILVSANLAATTATTGLAGYLADRVGERTVLFAGSVMYAAGLGMAMIVPDFQLFLIFIVVNGLGSGFMLTPTYVVVGSLMPKSRGLGIGAISGLYNLGGFVGPAVTSFLLAAYGWKLPFGLFSIVAVCSGLLILATLRTQRRISSTTRGSRGLQRFSFLVRRNAIVVATSMFLADMAFLAFISWTPTFMRVELDMSPQATGVTFGAAILLGGVGVISMGYLFDRVGGKVAAILCGSLSALLTLTFFLQSEPSLLPIVVLLLAGLITNTFWSLLSALAQVGVEEHELGTVTGTIQNIGFLGAIVGPTIVGTIVSAAPLSLALIISVSLPFFVYAALMLFYRA
jgi:MFS family permease